MARKQVIAAVLLTPMLCIAGNSALAGHGYSEAEVLSAEPLYETVSVSVPRQECRQEQVAYREGYNRPRGSATPTIVGAIIGGALGNAVGHGHTNKKVGAAVGAILGGSIGRDIGRKNQAYAGDTIRYRTEEVCTTVEDIHEQERLAGYRVTYRFAGETYTTRTRRDPGDTLRVRVRVTPVEG